MKVELAGVTKGAALPPVTLAYASGELTLVEAETEERPTVLGLIASGRMRPAAGEVRIDGVADSARLRRSVALVDAPAVSEPPPGVTLAGVVAEELMFAGRWGSRRQVATALAELGAASEADSRMADLAPATRVRLLAELALLRPGVEGLVVVSPDRHGGEPAAWHAHLAAITERGVAVLAVIGRPALAALEPWSAE